MQWSDEGYLLSKNNFDENSFIIEAFTLDHGKCSGIVYGGASRKQKKIFQAGNKIFLNWISKAENKSMIPSTSKPIDVRASLVCFKSIGISKYSASQL